MNPCLRMALDVTTPIISYLVIFRLSWKLTIQFSIRWRLAWERERSRYASNPFSVFLISRSLGEWILAKTRWSFRNGFWKWNEIFRMKVGITLLCISPFYLISLSGFSSELSFSKKKKKKTWKKKSSPEIPKRIGRAKDNRSSWMLMMWGSLIFAVVTRCCRCNFLFCIFLLQWSFPNNHLKQYSFKG